MSKTKSGQVIGPQRTAETNGVRPATCRESVRDNRSGLFGFVVSLSKEPLFLPENVVIEPDVQRLFSPHCVSERFIRHITGDWGDMDEERKHANTVALATGAKVVSEFKVHIGLLLRFVTDGDRIRTTVTLVVDGT